MNPEEARQEIEKIGGQQKVAIAKSLISGKDSRIGTLSAVFMLFLAGVTDLLTLIPVVGTLIDFAYWALFTLYMGVRGFGWLNFRRIATTLVSFAIEFIPGIQGFPSIILATGLIILFIRFEDKTGHSVLKMVGHKGRAPLNQNGVRLPNPVPQDAIGIRNANLKPLNSGGIRAPSARV